MTDTIKRDYALQMQYMADEMESLRVQVADLMKELDSMRFLAANPYAIEKVKAELGPLSLWGAKALDAHIANKLAALTAERGAERDNRINIIAVYQDQLNKVTKELQAAYQGSEPQTRELLAAAQAREERLRDALTAIERPLYKQCLHDGYPDECQLVFDATLLPFDDTALQERLAAERERCAAIAEDTAAGRDAEAIADVIRSMK